MRKCLVYQKNIPAGHLTEHQKNSRYEYQYLPDYSGLPISLTIPIQKTSYWFDAFPSFFDGLLPEGYQLEALVRRLKIDRDDSFSQLVTTGKDMVGSITVEEV
ncbi:MAG: toxin HipA [Deltaproteobacteria bacterium]|nr:toxin HipA [Deltaproteobacteria bacterium]MBT7713412.1 toxin HipA [Deltaproteobacteria bacterium]